MRRRARASWPGSARGADRVADSGATRGRRHAVDVEPAVAPAWRVRRIASSPREARGVLFRAGSAPALAPDGTGGVRVLGDVAATADPADVVSSCCRWSYVVVMSGCAGRRPPACAVARASGSCGRRRSGRRGGEGGDWPGCTWRRWCSPARAICRPSQPRCGARRAVAPSAVSRRARRRARRRRGRGARLLDAGAVLVRTRRRRPRPCPAVGAARRDRFGLAAPGVGDDHEAAAAEPHATARRAVHAGARRGADPLPPVRGTS